MNKTEYTNFIKKLIDNLHDVLLHSDATVDCTPKLERIRRAVVERPEYVFAALNPKSEMAIKFPYVLVAICYALRNLTCKAFLADMPAQNIEKLAGCVTETENLGAPDYLDFKGIKDEVYQKAIEITNMIGLRWDVVAPVFDKRASEIDAVYKKYQEEQRTRRRYSNNTVEIEELVAVLYPNADKTIEQKTKKFWRAIERASKSNPKVQPDNWFVTEDGVKKFCRRYYDKLCVFLGITKVPRAGKLCTIEELAVTLYPNDAAARKNLSQRIQYLRTSAPLSFADYAKLAGFFASGEGGILLFRKGHEQELLDFLDNIPQKPRKVVPENTLTFEELADLVFYDEADTDKRVGKLYSRKGYVMARLTPQRKQNVESWFIQIWGGKCLKKEHYVEFFNLMRPGDTIPPEQLTMFGIENYTTNQQVACDRKPNNFINVPETIDDDLPFDELAKVLYPKLSSPLSYLHKRKCYLLRDYPEYAAKMDEWFKKGAKGKMWLRAEYYPQFKEFLSLPLKSGRPKSPSQMKKGITVNFGRGMSGVKALEAYLQRVQNLMIEITQKRNEALERQKQHIKMAIGTSETRNFKDMVAGVTAAQHEQIIIEDCDEQMAKLQQNANEATALLQRARDAEDAWLEINAQIKDFLLQKGK